MPKFDPTFANTSKWPGFLLIALLLAGKSFSQVYPVDTLMRNGERANRINLVYLSDGYQSNQLATYITDANTISNGFFGQAPFSQYKNYFNAYAIKVPSVESGAIHPGTASDEASSNGQPVANPDIIFQSTFDFASIHRLLVPQNYAGVSAALAINLPDYTQVFVVVNSPYYGGSGGTFATASTDPSAVEVAIHEIGHSFAGLADEYWAGDAYAAEKPNMTANGNPATVKWKNWIGIDNIGVYPYGASGNPANWYRPHQNCKMQFLGVPFCAVCTEQIITTFHQLISMIDGSTPATNSFTLSNSDPVAFSVTAIQNDPSTTGIKWYLNGSATPFATNQFSVSIPYASFATGNNTVRAEVIDSTLLSKTYLPGVGYVNNLTWTVNNPIVLPVHLFSFSGRTDNNSALLNWEIDAPDELQSFELEKSRDGIHFSKLATVAGKSGTKKYNYTDENLSAPHSYYRINIREKGGSSYRSNTIRLQSAFDKFYYKVYQDAATHKYHLSVGITDPARLAFKITDLQGKLVFQKDLGIAERQVEYDFDLAGKPAGNYFMTLYFRDNPYTIQLLAQ